MLSVFGSLLIGVALLFLQALAAVPWVVALILSEQDRRVLMRALLHPFSAQLVIRVGIVVLVILGIDLGFGTFVQEREALENAGRAYAALLQLQLTLDFFLLGFWCLLKLWPKGGAVAQAAFREGVRQWMFWLLVSLAVALMGISVFVPYFTFGEDYLVVKQLGYDTILLAAALFGTLAASLSISEEIEGRTAVTLLSKPISRRQFLLGKYVGIVLAGLFMFGMLAVWFEGVLLAKHWFERLSDTANVQESTIQESQRLGVVATPAWILQTLKRWDLPAQITDLLRGIGQWAAHTWDTLPGLALYFSQVMVLVALAVALATRVPMVVNLVTVLSVYFLSHLTPVLSGIAARAQATSRDSTVPRLLGFVTQVFDTLLPDLSSFRMDPTLLSDAPPPPLQFAQYVGSVTFYALLYTTIVLLLGLLLFEDKDVA
jgi:hypothetical protein